MEFRGNAAQQECKHDKPFRFITCEGTLRVGQHRVPGVWVCNCGYYLTFNPENFVEGIAYLDEPNPKATKTIELKESKT